MFIYLYSAHRPEEPILINTDQIVYIFPDGKLVKLTHHTEFDGLRLTDASCNELLGFVKPVNGVDD